MRISLSRVERYIMLDMETRLHYLKIEMWMLCLRTLLFQPQLLWRRRLRVGLECFIFYLPLGPYMPGLLAHGGFSYPRIVELFIYSPTKVFME